MLERRQGKESNRVMIKNSYHGQLYTILPILLLICVIIVPCVGCAPAAIQYQPNQGIVGVLGVLQAQQALKETVLRSINPQVVEVDVTDDFLHYRYRPANPFAMFGASPGATLLENRVFFVNVGRVEVFDNHLVFIRTAAGHIIAQIFFGNDQDTKMFADLMLSFHAQRSRGDAR